MSQKADRRWRGPLEGRAPGAASHYDARPAHYVAQEGQRIEPGEESRLRYSVQITSMMSNYKNKITMDFIEDKGGDGDGIMQDG